MVITQKKIISIIIPNFNGEKYLKTCLNSVLNSNYRLFELLLIDDGSTDKSIQIINLFRKNDKRISLIKNKSNIGASASRNSAIKKAKGDIIVFLDNDTEVKKNWLDELINPLLQDSSIGATQALILDFERRDLIQMAGGLLIPQLGLLAPFYQWERYSDVKNKLKERDIFAISAALAVRKEVLNIVGSFDTKESVFTEDLDFCWRIWIAKYRIVLAHKSIVYHWTKSVDMRSDMKMTKEKIYFHITKNSLRSIIKNYQIRNLIKFFSISLLINIARAILVLVRRGEVSAIVATFHGITWNIKNLKDTLNERKMVQSSRKCNDSLIMEKAMTRDSLWGVYKKFFRSTKLLW